MQVALHGGAPNKNIGDAFLLVWKFPKGCTLEDIARVTSAPDAVQNEVRSDLLHAFEELAYSNKNADPFCRRAEQATGFLCRARQCFPRTVSRMPYRQLCAQSLIPPDDPEHQGLQVNIAICMLRP